MKGGLFNHLSELIEEVPGVVGTGTALGVVLHRKRRQRRVTDAFDRVVVEIDVRHLEALRNRLGQHREVVVLGRDLDRPRLQVLHRMVAAPVAEFQLIGLGTAGQANHLMAQADTEDRVNSSDDLIN